MVNFSNSVDFDNLEIARKFQDYTAPVREKLLSLRQLILDVAAQTAGVGRLEESIKWGQPSFLTTETKSGSTIRIGPHASRVGNYAIYFHCQTTLVDTFKEMYRDVFRFEGDRAIVFQADDEVPLEELGHCISIALTYHLRKRIKV